MVRKNIGILLSFFLVIAVAACTPGGEAAATGPTTRGESTPASGNAMANPASVFCEEHGGKVELRQDAEGGMSGVCVFSDGSECDEWAYFRSECQPGGAQPSTDATDEPARADLQTWQVYQDEASGIRFEYPPGAVIEVTGDTSESLVVRGPLDKSGEYWPSIYINHPSGREEFRPSSDADLKQWLLDHNLVFADEQRQDLQIAGIPAVHVRREGRPQACGQDLFFFARDGQLFSVVILHTGSKEDWDLYNRFLSSIQF